MRTLAALALSIIASAAHAYTVEFGENHNLLAIRGIDVAEQVARLSTLKPSDHVVIDGETVDVIDIQFRWGLVTDPEIAGTMSFLGEHRVAFTVEEIIRNTLIDEMAWSVGPMAKDRFIVPYETGARRTFSEFAQRNYPLMFWQRGVAPFPNPMPWTFTVVTASTVPLPPAAWLFATALAMLGWMRAHPQTGGRACSSDPLATSVPRA